MPIFPRMRSKLAECFRRLSQRRDGAFAVEFAILALPFCVLLFATFETFVAFAAEDVLANGVENLTRKIRTGQITFAQGKTTDMSEAEFRQAVCDEISVMITCSATEVNSPSRLFVDVRQFASFAAMPRTIPRIANSPTADLDTTGFAFAPGGPNTINMVRIYYKWQVMTDFMRPYITNIRPANGSRPTDYLIVSTSTLQNEAYK